MQLSEEASLSSMRGILMQPGFQDQLCFNNNEVAAPIRHRDPVAGVVSDAGDGLPEFRCADDCRRTRLLPSDEAQM